jgi:hypothetical protein
LHHFRIQRKRGRRSKRAVDQTIEDLQRDERVRMIFAKTINRFVFKIEFVTIGEPLERKKREFIDEDELEELYRQYRQWKTDQPSADTDTLFDSSSFKMSFDDVYYKKQWYLVSFIQ